MKRHLSKNGQKKALARTASSLPEKSDFWVKRIVLWAPKMIALFTRRIASWRRVKRILAWERRLAPWMRTTVWAAFLGVVAWLLKAVVAVFCVFLLPIGDTTLTMRSLTMDVLRDQTLPLVVDTEALAKAAFVEISSSSLTSTFSNPKSIILKAPQADACPRIHLGVRSGRSIEIQPQAVGASQLPLADARKNRSQCSLVLDIDDHDLSVPSGTSIKLALGREMSVFEIGRIAAISGSAMEIRGAFALPQTYARRTHGIEIVSRNLKISLLAPQGESPIELVVGLTTGLPTRFVVDGDSKIVGWYLRRWWHCFLKWKLS